jgi:hypothetical protein
MRLGYMGGCTQLCFVQVSRCVLCASRQGPMLTVAVFLFAGINYQYRENWNDLLMVEHHSGEDWTMRSTSGASLVRINCARRLVGVSSSRGRSGPGTWGSPGRRGLRGQG